MRVCTGDVNVYFVLTVFRDAGDVASHQQERITNVGASMSTKKDAETVQRYLATQNAHKKINALKLLSLKKTSKGGTCLF